jgi:hypothetical protein
LKSTSKNTNLRQEVSYNYFIKVNSNTNNFYKSNAQDESKVTFSITVGRTFSVLKSLRANLKLMTATSFQDLPLKIKKKIQN